MLAPRHAPTSRPWRGHPAQTRDPCYGFLLHFRPRSTICKPQHLNRSLLSRSLSVKLSMSDLSTSLPRVPRRFDINPKPLGIALVLIALGAIYLAQTVSGRQAALYV